MEIKISVSDPQARKEYGGMKQFYIYSIKGQDQKGAFQIQRRYSDFDLLRLTILKRWPGYFVPSLPSKLKVSHSDEDFLEIRSMYLQKFLLEIAKNTLIWYSEQTQFFIRISNLQIEKVMSSYSKVDYSELIYRYSTNLKNYDDNPQKHKEDIQLFEKQLQSLYLKVQELRVKCEEIYNAEVKYQKKYGKLFNNLLVGYETKVRNLQEKDTIIQNEKNQEKRQKLTEALKEVPLQALFEEIKREKRQILAFQEIIQHRLVYQKEGKELELKIKDKQHKIQTLRGGKQSFMSKVRKVETSTEVQAYQKSIQKYTQELNKLKQICSYINYVLAEQEIGLFKQERINSYYKMVKTISVEQLKIINIERQFWIHLCQESCCYQIQQQQIQIKDSHLPPLNNLQQEKVEEQKCEVEKKKQAINKQQSEDGYIGEIKEQTAIQQLTENKKSQSQDQQVQPTKKNEQISQQGKQSNFAANNGNEQPQQKANQTKALQNPDNHIDGESIQNEQKKDLQINEKQEQS